MKYYALISGGKDSVALAHCLKNQNQLESCVFLDTGICSPRVRNWIETIPYPLEIYKSPESFDDLVRKYGFGRADNHSMWFNYLKGRALRVFKKKHEGEKFLLASGVRKRESKRRFKNTKQIGKIEGMEIHAPLFGWSSSEVWRYVYENKLEISPFYLDGFDYSGECICGCMAKAKEKWMLKLKEPEIYSRITKLEKEVGGVWGNQLLPRHRQKGQAILCETCAY